MLGVVAEVSCIKDLWRVFVSNVLTAQSYHCFGVAQREAKRVLQI